MIQVIESKLPVFGFIEFKIFDRDLLQFVINLFFALHHI